MKTKFLGVFLMMWAMIGLEAGAQHTANAKKVLVAYFFHGRGIRVIWLIRFKN